MKVIALASLLVLAAGACRAGVRPPEVRVIDPMPGAALEPAAGVLVTATAFGDVLSSLTVELDGATVGRVQPAPGTASGGFMIAIDARAVQPGPHALTATARALRSGSSASAPVSVLLVPSLAFEIWSPFPGQSVTGVSTISGAGTQDSFTSRVEWYVDGRLVKVQPGAPFTFSLDTTGFDNGPHRLTASVVALSGRRAVASVPFAIDNRPVDRFVGRLFRDLLDRPVDGDGLAYWTDRVSALRQPFAVALELENSTEGRSALTTRLYRAYLRRPAEPAAVAAALVSFRAGATARQLRRQLLSSPEYVAQRGGGIRAGFVAALYRDVLDREPDASAAFWVAELARGVPRPLVVARFLDTPEARGALVAGVFRRLLARLPAPPELELFTRALANGSTEEEVTAGVAALADYTGCPLFHAPSDN